MCVVGTKPQPPDTNFVWRLGGFTTLRERKVCSDTFTVGGFNWRIFCVPRGNNVDEAAVGASQARLAARARLRSAPCASHDLGLYLDVADSKQLPVWHLPGSARCNFRGWSRL